MPGEISDPKSEGLDSKATSRPRNLKSPATDSQTWTLNSEPYALNWRILHAPFKSNLKSEFRKETVYYTDLYQQHCAARSTVLRLLAA